MPTPASIAEVRRFNEKSLDLYAHLHSEAGRKQRELQGLSPVATVIRSATEAEILQIAEALDAGAILNPRMWVETFKVRDAAEAVQFQRAA